MRSIRKSSVMILTFEDYNHDRSGIDPLPGVIKDEQRLALGGHYGFKVISHIITYNVNQKNKKKHKSIEIMGQRITKKEFLALFKKEIRGEWKEYNCGTVGLHGWW